MSQQNNGYEIFDRMYWLMGKKDFTRQQYEEKFERNRRTFYRDIEHLQDFYNYQFEYDNFNHKWINKGNK